MAINLAPIGNDAPFFLPTGVAASGAKLFIYAAGSATKTTTYTDSGGLTQNTNPVILNSSGYPAAAGNVVEIWTTSGAAYKYILAPSTDSDPPSSPYWTRDNVSGINDATVTVDQWVAGATPTYISATSFSLVGDQTATYHVGRRLKTTNTAGTVYSTITASAFAAATTVTVVNDSGTLDSGLSAVSYGLISATSTSLPPFNGVVALTTVAGTNTITAKGSQGYVTNQMYVLIPAATNTGATTLNISGQGAKNVFAWGAACAGGEMVINVPTLVQYDGTQFNIIAPIGATVTNTLSGDVALNNTGNFFDGPSCAQGTVGKWWASGSVVATDTAGAATLTLKLWDGTTTLAACRTTVSGASDLRVVHLSGVITTPGGNIRISAKDATSTSGLLQFNGSGLSKDCTLTVTRIG